MRITIPIILTFLLASIHGISFGQDADSVQIKKISDDIFINGIAYKNLYTLCKKVGPRLSGSPQAELAITYTKKMLEEAGADTVYLQPCMVPNWKRGAKESAYIEMANGKRTYLKICALGNSVGTGSKGIETSIIEVKSFDELKQLGSETIKGHIVFFNFEMNPTYVRTFMAYGESGIARRQGPSMAAKYGAIGVIVRSLASNEDNFPHTGVTTYNDSFPKIPAVAISTNDAIFLSKQIKLRMQHRVFIQTNCSMQANVLSYNVIGEIRGSKWPEKIITVGGHLDSWDLAEGAHDDGAGIVQSIEVIRALKKNGIAPNHTIRAVMFMNEENGGAGADAYFKNAKEKNEKHLFALESDAGGFTPRGLSVDVNENQFNKILQWKPLLQPYGLYEFSKGGSGADIGQLKELGAALAGMQPDSQRYFDVHHASTDVFESVSKRELNLGAINMTAIIYLIDKYGL